MCASSVLILRRKFWNHTAIDRALKSVPHGPNKGFDIAVLRRHCVSPPHTSDFANWMGLVCGSLLLVSLQLISDFIALP